MPTAPGERARDAVHRLHRAGIRFAITSGRPPRGMAVLVDPLAIDNPIAAFNGGTFVRPDLSIIEERELASDVARQAMDMISEARPRGLGSLRR